ncbi:MAG: hypothetical protein WD151_09900, partial [Phycisphaeraceae bacterium]
MTVTDILLLLYFVGLVAAMLVFLARGTFAWKPALILFVLSLCTLGMWWPGHYTPDRRLRPGLDLAGGTTLIYDVRVPEDADASQVIDELIDVLRDRVDPTGTRNLTWRQAAGNRIEIRMAAAPREVAQLRQAFQDERDALLEGNITRQELDQALRAEGAAQAAAFRELAKVPASDGAADDAEPEYNEELLARLQSLAEVHEAFLAATEPYEQAQQRYRAAQRELEGLPEGDEREAAEAEVAELRDQLDQATLQFVRARQAFERERGRVMATNIDPSELQRALESSTAERNDRELYREFAPELASHNVGQRQFEQLLEASGDEQQQILDQLAGDNAELRQTLEEAIAIRGLSPRERLIRQLEANHPDRADQIARVDEAARAYDRVRGPLDDPNDLKAMLRGAGVLEFRIAASGQRADVDVERYREQLQEGGPRAGAHEPWRWYPVNDITRFAETRPEQDMLAQDPAGYFANYGRAGLVGDRYGDQYYLLLADT